LLTPLNSDDPTEIGPFRLQSRIGAGGMGTVYLGFTDSGRPVALKVPTALHAGDPEFRGRFRNEVAAARRVRGTSVAEVIDADVDDERPWMATEYVEGTSLAEAVSRRGALEGPLLTGLAVGLADALVAIHDAGVVHRDLKPANILLAWDGPKVIDFGIARSADGTSHTGTGMLIGTLSWMAPEQLRGEPATSATDVFAWGACVLFAALGRQPFRGDGPEVVAFQIMSAEPDTAVLPPALAAQVRRALDKTPARRPSAADLVTQLSGQEVRTADDAEEAAETVLKRNWSWGPTPPGGATPAGAVRGAVGGAVGGDGGSDGGARRRDQLHADPTRAARAAGPRPYDDVPAPTGRRYRDDAYPAEPRLVPMYDDEPSRRPPRRRDNRMVFALAAAVLVLAAAAGALLVRHNLATSDLTATGTATTVPPGQSAGAAGATGPSGALAGGAGTAPTAAASVATGPGAATKPPAKSTSPSISPSTSPTAGGQLSLADARAAVTARGYTPTDDTTYKTTSPVDVILGTATGATDGHTQLAFFFANGKLIGTDTKDPSAGITLISASGDLVELGYAIYLPADPLSTPSGGTQDVRYHWTGTTLDALDPIPSSDPTQTGRR
jgi:Protein kinase domain/LppP/LprE lipoprotein